MTGCICLRLECPLCMKSKKKCCCSCWPWLLSDWESLIPPHLLWSVKSSFKRPTLFSRPCPPHHHNPARHCGGLPPSSFSCKLLIKHSMITKPKRLAVPLPYPCSAHKRVLLLGCTSFTWVKIPFSLMRSYSTHLFDPTFTLCYVICYHVLQLRELNVPLFLIMFFLF